MDFRLTAQDITNAIARLPKNQRFRYIDPKNKGDIQIVEVEPENLRIKRGNSSKGKSIISAKEESISSPMLWRVANAFVPGKPINFDRVLGGSYNTRSVLEALLAHTPEFYVCHPKRIEITSSSSTIKPGHKHLIWRPDFPHTPNTISEYDADITISEVPGTENVYDALDISNVLLDNSLDIEVVRRHSQIQIALVLIGAQLGYRSWIARNDRSIVYNHKPIGELQGVIARLEDEKLVASYQDVVKAALLIDCIWFRNSRFMPAVIEIEHSTGVTSGLTRMKGLFDCMPPFPTRYVIVAADEDRNKVISEANRPQFQALKPLFFPYSAVEELYALCQRRKLDSQSVNESFLDCFMEKVVS